MVGHVRRSGGLSNYLLFFPVLHRYVNSVFDNQFEIRTHSHTPTSYTFSIFNKNSEVYRAETYPTKDKCDSDIEWLVDNMRNWSAAKPPLKTLQGTWWIQLKDGTRVVCESIGLRTENEARELFKESREKIPNCKYSRGQ